jgi:hypothetical protein
VVAWLVLAALCCLYVTGEETSWGQHLFGWSTPEEWAAVNDQNETNLHNTSAWFDQKPRLLLGIAIGVGGIGVPLLALRRPAIRRGRFAIVLPPFVTLPAAVIAIFVGIVWTLDGWRGGKSLFIRPERGTGVLLLWLRAALPRGAPPAPAGPAAAGRADMSEPVPPTDRLAPLWWLWLPLAFLAMALVTANLWPAFYELYVDGEHGFMESLQALHTFIALLVALSAIPLARARGKPWLVAYLALAVLACFYVTGEELSWGQHFFGWSTPEGWAEINDQEETNLHNLGVAVERGAAPPALGLGADRRAGDSAGRRALAGGAAQPSGHHPAAGLPLADRAALRAGRPAAREGLDRRPGAAAARQRGAGVLPVLVRAALPDRAEAAYQGWHFRQLALGLLSVHGGDWQREVKATRNRVRKM